MPIPVGVSFAKFRAKKIKFFGGERLAAACAASCPASPILTPPQALLSALLGILYIIVCCSGVHAQSLKLQDMPLGKSATVGSFDYVKVANNAFMQSNQVECPDGSTVGGLYVKCYQDSSEACCTTTCPPNSAYSTTEGKCICDDGYTFDNVVSACIADESVAQISLVESFDATTICRAAYGDNYIFDTKSGKCIVGCDDNSTYNSSTGLCTCAAHTYANTSASTTAQTTYTAGSGGSCRTWAQILGITTMDAFRASHCSSIPTPSGTEWVEVGWLKDTRNGVSYEIRKYADGKCWMATNLTYGSCSKGVYQGYGQAYESTSTTGKDITGRMGFDSSGNAMHGDCRNAGTYVGYLYNWQAIFNDASAYHGNAYDPDGCTAGGSLTHITGICPTNWRLPHACGTTSSKNDFKTLYEAVGSKVAFFTGDPWNNNTTGNPFSGLAYHTTGDLKWQGVGANWWSSSQVSATNAYNMYYYSSGFGPANNGNKAHGFSVRCIAN